MINNCQNNVAKKITPFTAIVTGATGFVGRHVVAELIKKNYKVIALVRDVDKAKKLKYLQDAEIIGYDIKSINKFLSVPENCTLIHCAWDDVRDTLSLKHIEEHFLNNYFFIKKLLQQGVKKILVTGSCFEYGLQFGPVSAATETRPNTPYALAKDMLHKSLRSLQSKIDFQLIWARLFYMHGDGQDSQSIIPLFDSALTRGEKEFNMSFGEQLFDYLPVEIAAKKIITLLDYENGVYNICSGQPISLRRMLETRMADKNIFITLNLGHFEYRKQDAIAIWGADPV